MLYRFFNSDHRLLYVGITDHGPKRWDAHAREKRWWGDVATITLERHPIRLQAETAEATAIAAEQPLHNKPSGPIRGRKQTRGMTHSDHRRFAAHLLAQQDLELEAWLLEQRGNHDSYERIARSLFVLTDQKINVTSRTIANWINSLKEDA